MAIINNTPFTILGMRKLFSTLIVIISIFIIVTISILIYKKAKNQKRFDRTPNIGVTLIDNSTFNISDTRKSLAITFFNPGCNHCENEAEEISKYRNKLLPSEILMVSLSPRDSIKEYARRHKLDQLPNIHFATDSLAKLHMLYGVQTIPTTFIYGSDGRLRKRFNGEVSIKALMRELR